ncbi:MAG: ABC transporter permease [Lactovum sp.]
MTASLFYQTKKIFLSLIRRDRFRLIIWLFSATAFAVVGAGKMGTFTENPETANFSFVMFQNPAMVAMMGPIMVEDVSDFTVGAAFSQAMLLLTAIFCAILSIIYVINRTRKEEDDGIREIFRSFPVGRLSNSAALVIELFFLHLILLLTIALSMQLLNIEGLNQLSSSLLFAGILSAQGFMWGILALICAQIFPDTSTVKVASFSILAILYSVRILYDGSNQEWGWLNPLSWSYLTKAYVKDNWTALILTLIFSVVLLYLAFILEKNRELNASYIPEWTKKSNLKSNLSSFLALNFRLQRMTIISWLIGVFFLAVVYGSLFGQIDGFIKTNDFFQKMFAISSKDSLIDSFLATILIVISLLIACMALQVVTHMISEEKKGRQEQLYALPLGRLKVYMNYVSLSLFLVFLGELVSASGIWLAQFISLEDTIPFLTIFSASLVWIAPIFLVLSIATFLMAYIPKCTSLSWFFIAYALFNSYIGRLLELPKEFTLIDIFSYMPQLPIDQMDWENFITMLLISLLLFVISFLGYKKRDLKGG